MHKKNMRWIALAVVFLMAFPAAHIAFAAVPDVYGYKGDTVGIELNNADYGGGLSADALIAEDKDNVFQGTLVFQQRTNGNIYLSGTISAYASAGTHYIAVKKIKDNNGSIVYDGDVVTITVKVSNPPSDPVPTAEPMPIPTIPPPVANSGDLVVDDVSTPQDLTPGQVTVILPLKYKGGSARMGLRFLEVTPAIDDPKAWPFEIESTSYLRTLGDVLTTVTPEGRVYDYIPFTFNVKPDMYNGYYLISFNARYQGAAENVWLTAPVDGKLSLYVKIVNGKPEPTPEPSYKPEATAKPLPEAKLILAGYTTDPEVIIAGQPFDLTLDLFNTSSVTRVRNVKCTLTVEESQIMPASGSSSFYIDEVGKGEHLMETITFTSQTSAGLKPAQITLKMDYEDEKLNKLSATELFTVALKPLVNLSLDQPRYNTDVMVGDQFNLMMNIFNKGKSPLYNVTVSLESDRLEAEELYFAGNMEPGSSRTYDTMVTLYARPGEAGGGGESVEAMPMRRGMAIGGAMVVSRSAPSGVVVSGGAIGGSDGAEPAEGEGIEEDGAAPGDDWVEPGYAEGIIVVTYEDSFGEEAREEMPIRVNVMSMPEFDQPMFNEKGELIDPNTGLPVGDGAPESAGAPPWIFIAGGAAILLVGLIMTVAAVRLRRRKRQDNEMV